MTFALFPIFCRNTKRWVWLKYVAKKEEFYSWDEWADYYEEIV